MVPLAGRSNTVVRQMRAHERAGVDVDSASQVVCGLTDGGTACAVSCRHRSRWINALRGGRCRDQGPLFVIAMRSRVGWAGSLHRVDHALVESVVRSRIEGHGHRASDGAQRGGRSC